MAFKKILVDLILKGTLNLSTGDDVMAMLTPKSQGLEFRVDDGATAASPVVMSLQDSTLGAGLNLDGYFESSWDSVESSGGAYRVIRTLDGSTFNPRGWSDKTIMTNPDTDEISYAGMDVNINMNDGTYGHHTMFQGRSNLSGSIIDEFEGVYIGPWQIIDSTVTDYVGYTMKTPIIFDSDSSITNFIGSHIIAEDKDGSITNLYGMKIELGTSSATNLWSVHAPDVNMDALMSGNLEIGSLICTGDAGASQFTQDSGNIVTFGSSSFATKYIEIRPGSNYGLQLGLQVGGALSSGGGALMASKKVIAFKAGVSENTGFANITAPHLLIDLDGNIGIGTIDPDSRLTIKSSGANSTTSGINIIGNTTTNSVVNLFENGTDGGGLRIYDGGVAKINITSNSNSYFNGGLVGIGTSNPDAKLHIATSGESKLDIEDTGGQQYRLFTRNSDKVFGMYDVSNPRTFFRYTGGATASSNKLSLLEGGGNLGVGTSSPDKLLEISGVLPTLRITSTENKTWVKDDEMSALEFYSEDTSGSGVGVRGSIKMLTSDTFGLQTDMTFNNGLDVERMRIDLNGNVGIGTTSPDFKLDLGDSTDSSDLFRVNGSNAAVLFSGNVTAPTGGVGLWNFINSGTNAVTRFYVQDANNSNSRLTFDFKGNSGAIPILAGTSSGNVGIGTTSPGQKLEVEGNVRISKSSLRT